MKTIRRFLIPATVLVALGGAGIGVARPRDQKHANPPAAADHDSFHITVSAQQGRLGLSVLQISPELRVKLGATRDRGVLVNEVRADSPAAKAGVQVGDVVTDIDGDAVDSASDMIGAMSDLKRGDNVTIAAMRDGKRVDMNAMLDADAMASPRMFSGRGFDIDPNMRNWLREMPSMGSDELKQQLDDAQKRIDELEQRLDKLEHH